MYQDRIYFFKLALAKLRLVEEYANLISAKGSNSLIYVLKMTQSNLAVELWEIWTTPSFTKE